MENFFQSSDSARFAGPLRHARCVSLPEPLALEFGGELPGVTVCFETYGRLSADKSNAVLICHALSGDSHVARHDPDDEPGWWDVAVGPGKPIDTDRFHVICPNLLGGCRGTTGPNSLNPITGKPYGADFPRVTIGDMVTVQKRLLDHLGIERLLAVVGGSMGGQLVLCWAGKYPDAVAGAVPIATAPRLTSQALAFDIVGRNAILRDPNFRNGQYYDAERGPDVGLAIARMIGHVTYLSRELMRSKFEADRYEPRDVQTDFEKSFSVGSYLGYQGERFVDRFDANSYVTLSRAMDAFDLGAAPESLETVLGNTACQWLFLSFSSDWLFPPDQAMTMVNALIAQNRRVSYCEIPSICGHDAFLLPNDVDIYGEFLRAFLDNLLHPRCCVRGRPCPAILRADSAVTSAVSIFHANRLDHDRIAELIPERASVLDLGCGNGGLLCRLKQRGHARVMGVELDEQAVLNAVRSGHDVVHADLNRHSLQFGDRQFDVVVLSQTLQAVLDVQGVLDEMLRVGRQGIVSFPNFAYHKLRRMLAEEGRAPEAGGVLRYHWFNTPNLRFLSIRDFEDLCATMKITIHRMLALDTEAGKDIREDPNRNADLAIFVLSK